MSKHLLEFTYIKMEGNEEDKDKGFPFVLHAGPAIVPFATITHISKASLKAAFGAQEVPQEFGSYISTEKKNYYATDSFRDLQRKWEQWLEANQATRLTFGTRN